jgi:hypothetical protein
MIVSQLRRDFAVRSLSWWLPIAVLMGGFIWWRGSTLPSAPGDIYKAIFFVWVALSIFFLNARYASRCSSSIEITWPVATRRLWLTHVLAIVFSGLALLGAIVATVGAGNALSGARPLLDDDLTSLAVGLGVGMILALAALQSPKVSLYEIPVRTSYVMLTTVSVGGMAGLAVLLIDRPLAWVLVPLAVALVLGFRTYRSLPNTLKLASRVSDRHRGAAGAGWQDSAVRDIGRAAFAWRLFSTIWCSPRGRWTWWYVPLLGLHGVVLSLSVTWSGRGDWDKIQLPYVVFAWVILASWLMVSISRLWAIDPLPISRRRVFAALTVPALLSVAVGYGLGWAATARSRPPGPQIVDAEGSSRSLIKIPGEFWEIAWDGEVPATVTPWGETLRPCCAIPVVNGRRTGLYHPYYTPRESSPDVVAFQLSRALAGGYGVEMPYRCAVVALCGVHLSCAPRRIVGVRQTQRRDRFRRRVRSRNRRPRPRRGGRGESGDRL